MVLLLVHPRPRTSSNTVTVITSQIHAYQDGSPSLTIHCQTYAMKIIFTFIIPPERPEKIATKQLLYFLYTLLFVFMKNIHLHAIKEYTSLLNRTRIYACIW